ncbi:hypothetical protein B296_00039919 [Ensete ventricosum]|uniref:Uncharacterized protein n=1 Tax=Ensete ventricosum TaxID=4639 RepID=A0A426ZJL1_ENSVE|nr:hypothetical protein B296_00039919 [Ensete ventricosum]
MPPPHAAVAAHPPYILVISRGTTKVKGLALYLTLEFNSFSPETQNSTRPRGLFGILANLGIGGASPGHPLPPPERHVCKIAIPETAPGTHQPNSPSRTPEGASIHRKFRPSSTLADLRTRTRTGRADTSARL